MNKLLILFSFSFFAYSFSQEKLKFEVINHLEKDSIKTVLIQREKDEDLNIFFYNNHFQIIENFPHYFYNIFYKNRKFKSNEKQFSDCSKNYKFDEWKRLISYSVCSKNDDKSTIVYHVEYNDKGNIKEIYSESDINDAFPELNGQYPTEKFTQYIFTYNSENKLIRLDEKIFKSIIKSIKLLE